MRQWVLIWFHHQKELQVLKTPTELVDVGTIETVDIPLRSVRRWSIRLRNLSKLGTFGDLCRGTAKGRGDEAKGLLPSKDEKTRPPTWASTYKRWPREKKRRKGRPRSHQHHRWGWKLQQCQKETFESGPWGEYHFFPIDSPNHLHHWGF